MSWPLTFAEDHSGYRCSIELGPGDSGDEPRVIAIKVERLDGRALSLRDVRRLPLATAIVRAKQAAALVPGIHDPSLDPERARQDRAELLRRLERARAPRGTPQRGKSERWYAELLEAHRALVVDPTVKHPNAELARRMKKKDPKVNANTMNQWLRRARLLEAQRLESQHQLREGKG